MENQPTKTEEGDTTASLNEPLVPVKEAKETSGEQEAPTVQPSVQPSPAPEKSEEEATVNVSKKAWDDVQEQLKMLKTVADKGRVFKYESQKAAVGKKEKKINLSMHGDKVIVGWATLKDILVKHPTTGMTVGEEQEYEVVLLGKDDSISKLKVNGYVRFSDIRYTERVEAEVVGQTEDLDGNITFDVQLLDGRTIKLDQKFIN